LEISTLHHPSPLNSDNAIQFSRLKKEQCFLTFVFSGTKTKTKKKEE